MKNKNYVIVGGSSGIGLSLVKQLVSEGANVTVISRTSENLQNMTSIRHIPLDVVADEFDKNDLPDEIHGLAYCPGTINLKPFRSLKMEDFQHDFDVNVMGAVKVLQASYRKFVKGDASVVLFSTVAVGLGMPFHSSIAAAKGAVTGLTKSLAAEWSPNIRVNCIAPSLVNTPLADRLLSTPEKEKDSANRHPLKRVGKPEDIAEMAAYLLSDKSSWMSGQVIGVDGGMSSLKVSL